MRDAVGRPDLARALIEGRTISIEIATAQALEELSVSIYHELLEAMTVGVQSPPRAVWDLNEAGFEQVAQGAHRLHGLANSRSVIIFLSEFGFTD